MNTVYSCCNLIMSALWNYKNMDDIKTKSTDRISISALNIYGGSMLSLHLY